LLAPALASAFTGNLVRCAPTAGVKVPASIKPGLTCTNALNKISVAATAKNGNQVDGCAYNAAAPWDAWAGAKLSKTTSAAAATISKMDVSVKTVSFASCNFSGDATSYRASGAGKFQFYDSTGTVKVLGGGGSFFADVAGDVASISAIAHGLITKGFGAGAAIEIQIGLDLAGPSQCGMTSCNGLVLACNTGAICPPDPFSGAQPPITTLDLVTAATSHVSIDLPDNANCTGPHMPILCCTGAGTGGCS
jgi:hypothetical protein